MASTSPAVEVEVDTDRRPGTRCRRPRSRCRGRGRRRRSRRARSIGWRRHGRAPLSETMRRWHRWHDGSDAPRSVRPWFGRPADRSCIAGDRARDRLLAAGCTAARRRLLRYGCRGRCWPPALAGRCSGTRGSRWTTPACAWSTCSRTIDLPWPAIQDVDTKWALTLRHRVRAVTRPGPHRRPAARHRAHAHRPDVKHLPASTVGAGDSVRPGDLPSTSPSGRAALADPATAGRRCATPVTSTTRGWSSTSAPVRWHVGAHRARRRAARRSAIAGAGL